MRFLSLGLRRFLLSCSLLFLLSSSAQARIGVKEFAGVAAVVGYGAAALGYTASIISVIVMATRGKDHYCDANSLHPTPYTEIKEYSCQKCRKRRKGHCYSHYTSTCSTERLYCVPETGRNDEKVDPLTRKNGHWYRAAKAATYLAIGATAGLAVGALGHFVATRDGCIANCMP